MRPNCELILSCPDEALHLLRKLELGGDLVVQPGDRVEPDSLLGHNSAEELLHYLRIEVDETKPLAKLLKQVGDDVKRGEPVAYYMFMFGLGYREYVSPVNGTIVSFEPRNGLIAIREHRTPLFAGAAGTIESVIPGYGAVLATSGTIVEGTAGWGDVAWGELMLLADGPDSVVDASQINAAVRGKIAFVGAYADDRLLQACYRHGARAVVAGGVSQIAADAFTAFASSMTFEEYATRYYSGSGISDVLPDGADSVPMPILALEGLGRLAVRESAYDLLAGAAGRAVFIDAAGNCLARGGAPYLVLSPGGDQPSLPRPGSSPHAIALTEGSLVRVIGGPHNGEVATVTSLLPEITLVTGLRVPGALLHTGDRARSVDFEAPVANLEVILTGR